MSFNIIPEGQRPKKGETPKAKDVATQVELDLLSERQKNTLDQLAVLRSTRGQRDVGSLKVPANLQAKVVLDDSGVEKRATRAGGD